MSGGYEYCHYLYDGTDDRGWGCGYRTLQTIISWIKHNSNAAVPVPSIRKIQETLVEVKQYCEALASKSFYMTFLFSWKTNLRVLLVPKSGLELWR